MEAPSIEMLRVSVAASVDLPHPPGAPNWTERVREENSISPDLLLLMQEVDPRGGNGDYYQREDLKNFQQNSQGPSRCNQMHTDPQITLYYGGQS